MANVNDPFAGIRDQPGQDHSFDDQVRGAEQKLTVFECARLALVAIDDDVRPIVGMTHAGRADGVAHVAPFLRRGNSRTAHAAKIGVGVVQLFKQLIRPAADIGSPGPVLLRLPGMDRVANIVFDGLSQVEGTPPAGRSAAARNCSAFNCCQALFDRSQSTERWSDRLLASSAFFTAA